MHHVTELVTAGLEFLRKKKVVVWVTENPRGTLQRIKIKKMHPVKLNGNVDLGILDVSKLLLCIILCRENNYML